MSVITGQGVTAYPLPDEELSPTSKNAVSNEAVCEGLDELKNTLSHKADAIYDTASGDIASFPDGADGLPVKDLTVGIEPVQAGSGDPSPTNIRPISGWTGCNVSRTGKNLINVAAVGDITPIGTTVTRSGLIIPIKSGKRYVFSHTSGDSMNIRYYQEDGTVIGIDLASNATEVSLTPYQSVVSIHSGSVAAFTGSVALQLEQRDSGGRTEYEPFAGGITIPISWQSSAGTVYGGTLDVTSGVLTSEWKKVKIGDLSWDTQGGNYGRFTTIIQDGAYNANLILCKSDIYKAYSDTAKPAYTTGVYIGYAGSPTNSALIKVYDTEYPTAEDLDSWKAARANNEILYKLATPLVYQLDSHTIETLLGQNNIWSDTGDSTVEYPADTKLYIQKINAPSDDDMIADANIASGKYFIVNNNLYLSTTTILAGDPIKPGTNCTLTNLAAALNALNS